MAPVEKCILCQEKPSLFLTQDFAAYGCEDCDVALYITESTGSSEQLENKFNKRWDKLMKKLKKKFADTRLAYQRKMKK